MVERRAFIKNGFVLSVGLSLGVGSKLLSNQAFDVSSTKDIRETKLPGLENEWNIWVKNMGGRSVGVGEDVSALVNDKHAVPFSKFQFHWGEVVWFEEKQVVARPLWQHWDGMTQALDYSVYFWEKVGGNWCYVLSLHSVDICALNNLLGAYSEKGSLVPRFGSDREALKTALGQVTIATQHSGVKSVSRVRVSVGSGLTRECSFRIG